MNEEAIRRESEQSSHDADYLCDLGTNFHDLSSNDDDSWTKHLRWNPFGRNLELALKHCTQIQKILKRQLLDKLRLYGIQGVSEDRFRSSSTNRRQKIDVNYQIYIKIFFSDWCILKHGGIQGWILGPVLFIIYINDLLLRIKSVSETILFVDNTSVIISSTNFENISSVKI